MKYFKQFTPKFFSYHITPSIALRSPLLAFVVLFLFLLLQNGPAV